MQPQQPQPQQPTKLATLKGVLLIWTVLAAVVFAGAWACIRYVHDGQMIRGEWKAVSVEGLEPGSSDKGNWRFDGSRVNLPSGYTVSYSINPIFGTLSFRDTLGRDVKYTPAEYKLDGDSMTIWRGGVTYTLRKIER
jgi:hypothetical protein